MARYTFIDTGHSTSQIPHPLLRRTVWRNQWPGGEPPLLKFRQHDTVTLQHPRELGPVSRLASVRKRSFSSKVQKRFGRWEGMTGALRASCNYHESV